jgi:hypothetical protein
MVELGDTGKSSSRRELKNQWEMLWRRLKLRGIRDAPTRGRCDGHAPARAGTLFQSPGHRRAVRDGVRRAGKLARARDETMNGKKGGREPAAKMA